MKENYQVTIGYKAVITVDVQANSEEEAREIGLQQFIDNERDKWFKRKGVTLQGDSFADYGVTNMDKTWNTL